MLTAKHVRRFWPDVLEKVKAERRFTWVLLSQNAQVVDVRNGTLMLAMSNVSARDGFARADQEAVLREAIFVVMGARFVIETVLDEKV